MSTIAGSFSTSCEAKINPKVSKLNIAAYIFAPFQVTTKNSNHDVNFGRDLLPELGIELEFPDDITRLPNINFPTKSINCKRRTHFIIHDSKNVRYTTKWIKKILDVNAKKANSKKLVNNTKYLSNEDLQLILKLFRKHQEII